MQKDNIIIGDFNAYNLLWSKITAKKQGDTLLEWINQNHLTYLDPPLPTKHNLPLTPSPVFPLTIP